jgi:phosphomannomutase
MTNLFKRLFVSRDQSFDTVDEQKQADPEFSPVKSPILEEGKETWECTIATANRNNADLILATDPDADRFASAERDSTVSSTSKWTILSSDSGHGSYGQIQILKSTVKCYGATAETIRMEILSIQSSQKY